MTTHEEQIAAERRLYADERAAARERQREAPGPKWYIVQCIHGTDQQALAALDRFRIATYYPKIMTLKPLPRRRMSTSQRQSGLTIQAPQETALFPRYVFIHFDISHGDWHGAFDMAGVGGLVCRSGMPVYMPDQTIAAIRKRENNGLISGKDSVRVVFGVAEEVIVTNGPFASFPGTVEEGLDVAIADLVPSMRIKVAVNIFGRATPVDLEHWQVSKPEG